MARIPQGLTKSCLKNTKSYSLAMLHIRNVLLCLVIEKQSPAPKAYKLAYSICRHPASVTNDFSSEAVWPICFKFHK